MGGNVLKLPLLLALSLLLAGCAREGVAPVAPDAPTSTTFGARPTIVALIDSGINPYHDVFSVPHDGSPLAATSLGIDATRVVLATEGDYASRVAADDAFWSSVVPWKLYAFAGTRILAMTSLDSQAGILDTRGHGTATASLVAREDPGAVILLIQARGELCMEAGCIVDPSVGDAMAWAADQPWIDIITVSAGLPANAPDDPRLHAEAERYLTASRLAHSGGKILIASAGNDPSPSTTDYFSGPPWVISVGGFEPSQRGETVEASKFVDVVANYSEFAALEDDTTGTRARSGTSFAAPIVAGTISRALREARWSLDCRDGSEQGYSCNIPGGGPPLVPSDLRAALNATARYVAPTEWDPTNRTLEDPIEGVFTNALPILSGPAQMGWGHVEGSLWREMLDWILEGKAALPPEKQQTAAYQSQLQASRESKWG